MTELAAGLFTFYLDPSGLIFAPVQLRPLIGSTITISREVRQDVLNEFGVTSHRLASVLTDGSECQVISLKEPTPNDAIFYSFGKTFCVPGGQCLLELATPLPEAPNHGIFLDLGENIVECRLALRDKRTDGGRVRPQYQNRIRPLHIVPNFATDTLACRKLQYL